MKTIIRFAVFTATAGLLHAAAFTSGNLAILQAAASANNTTASIVEINTTTAGQAAVQTIAIPDGASVGNGLRFSGSATSTGYLSSSADRTLLTFNGANSSTTASNVNTLNPRGVGTLNNAGTYALQTTYTGTSGQQTRSSTTLNGTDWFIADQGGLYTNAGTLATATLNGRGIKAFGGTVYVGQASATVTTIAVSTVSNFTGGTITGLNGLTNNASFQDFYLTSSGTNGSAFDILYTVSATSNTAGSIAKFSLVSGTTWTANGSYTTTFGGFGIAATSTIGGADLYVTTGQGALTANSVIKLSDTAGFNSAITINTGSNTTLFTAPTGTILKGIEFAPTSAIPEPSSYAAIFGALALAGAALRRRSRK